MSDSEDKSEKDDGDDEIPNRMLSERALNVIRGKSLMNAVSNSEVMLLLDMIDEFEETMTMLDGEDYFGTEGWRRDILHFSPNPILTEKKLNIIRGKAIVNGESERDVLSLCQMIDGIIDYLDGYEYHNEDVIGNEGWRHYIGMPGF